MWKEENSSFHRGRQEVRAAIQKRSTDSRATPMCGGQVSIRACEMEAVVRVFQRDRSVPADPVARELELVLAEKTGQGVF